MYISNIQPKKIDKDDFHIHCLYPTQPRIHSQNRRSEPIRFSADLNRINYTSGSYIPNTLRCISHPSVWVNLCHSWWCRRLICAGSEASPNWLQWRVQAALLVVAGLPTCVHDRIFVCSVSVCLWPVGEAVQLAVAHPQVLFLVTLPSISRPVLHRQWRLQALTSSPRPAISGVEHGRPTSEETRLNPPFPESATLIENKN